VSRRGEGLLAVLAAVVATVLSDWTTVSTLARTVPVNLGDSLYFAWQLAWVGRALTTDPASMVGSMWTTNAFQQAPETLAYTDVVLGYAPLAWFTPPGQAGALAQLNLALLLATLTAALGGYLLARVLGARIPGAMVAAAGFGFAPWRDTQVIHVNIVSTGGIAISAALLAHGHGWSLRSGWQPERIRARWVLAGWLVAAWQLTFGFATGIWFGYFLALVMLALTLGWLVTGRRPIPGRVLLADLGGGLAFLGVAYLLLIPHLRVLETQPGAQRVPGMLDLFSPPWFGLLTAGEVNRVWGGLQSGWRAEIGRHWPPEMFMSPGILLLGLAVAGLFISAWPVRRRLAIGVITAVLAVLATGTRGPAGGRYTYLPLYDRLPGWEHLRTPGRLMIWVTMGLCLLAAGAITRICDELVAEWNRREENTWGTASPVDGYLRGRAGPARVALAGLLVLPAAGVFAEGLDRTPHWEVGRPPVELAALPQPILVLPTALVADYQVMLWSTEGWPVITNGDSGFDSAQQSAMRAQARTFPDAASVAALRARGVATVVVIRSRVGPESWQGAPDAPVTGLGITRTEAPDAVIFDLRR
jgi:hypothetical protein